MPPDEDGPPMIAVGSPMIAQILLAVGRIEGQLSGYPNRFEATERRASDTERVVDKLAADVASLDAKMEGVSNDIGNISTTLSVLSASQQRGLGREDIVKIAYAVVIATFGAVVTLVLHFT